MKPGALCSACLNVNRSPERKERKMAKDTSKEKSNWGISPPNPSMQKALENRWRKFTIAGAVVVAGIVISASLLGVAGASNGANLVLGQPNNATSRTSLSASFTGEGDVFESLYFAPSNSGNFGVGVWGGVLTANGEEGSNQGAGVWGTGGVHPRGLENPKLGTGVQGDGSRVGVGARSATGRALDVRGKAYFSNAGQGIISAGSRRKLVTNAKLDADALILVTLQGSAGNGVYLSHAKKIDATSFKVVLNKPAAVNTPFAWFIVN